MTAAPRGETRAAGAAVLAAALVAAVALGAPAPARASGGDELAREFARAGRDYAERRYDEAIARYESLLARGLRHPSVHVNLGSAYYRAGRLGPAILHFERALRLAPDDEDARFDLEVAREAVAVRFGEDSVIGAARDPLWMRVALAVPLSTLSWLFLALDVLFFGVLVVVRFLPSGFLRTGLIVGNVFTGLAGALVGVLLAGQIYVTEHLRLSVVVADEVVMRDGPDRTRREGPKLHAGHRVVLLRESQGWVRVRLANRVEGWVPAPAVEEL